MQSDKIKEANLLLDRAEEILMNIVYFNKNLVKHIKEKKMKNSTETMIRK